MTTATKTKSQAHDRALVVELLAEYKRTGERDIANRLVALNQNLVRYIAAKFTGRGEPLDDLIQVGNLGLFKAIERYDPSFGAQFSTFAMPTILGEIRRYFRDHGSALKIPRQLQELKLQILKVSEQYTRAQGCPPTAAIIAQQLNTTEERILEAQESDSVRHVASLDATADGRESVGSHLGSIDAGLADVENGLMVGKAIEVLTERERIVVIGRFYEQKSQSALAALLAVSQMQICRIEKAALKKMKEHLNSVAA